MDDAFIQSLQITQGREERCSSLPWVCFSFFMLAKRASRSYDKPMSVYRCTECGAWHVGTAIPRPQPMRWVNNHESRLI